MSINFGFISPHGSVTITKNVFRDFGEEAYKTALVPFLSDELNTLKK